MDHSGRAVFIKDLNGVFIQVNKDFLALLERPAEEVIGKTEYGLLPGLLCRKLPAARPGGDR